VRLLEGRMPMHKRCAHCGKEASFMSVALSAGKGSKGGYVRCLGCGVETPLCGSEDAAWTIWNKRVPVEVSDG
jgi:DNA-directed RNA polymerase subunit RPC12/RpoP